MLVFPERVLKGDIPNKDFLHLYGPGSLWALAGAFKVFGVSLITERVFGLFQQMAIVFGIYALARRWNRMLAVTGALTSAFIIIPFGLTALAWVGAAGLGVLGAVTGIEACARADDRVARRFAITSGVCFGLALLFRLDLVIAVALVITAIVVGHRPRTPEPSVRGPRRRGRRLRGPPRHRRPGDRHQGDDHRAGVQAPRRPQPAGSAAVVALRRVLAEGRVACSSSRGRSPTRRARSSCSSGSSCCSRSSPRAARSRPGA